LNKWKIQNHGGVIPESCNFGGKRRRRRRR